MNASEHGVGASDLETTEARVARLRRSNRVGDIGKAEDRLREARDLLLKAGSKKAAEAVRRALKSAVSAKRSASKLPPLKTAPKKLQMVPNGPTEKPVTCEGCVHLHPVEASPYGTSHSGPGCLLTGGHAVMGCSSYQQKAKARKVLSFEEGLDVLENLGIKHLFGIR